MNVLLWVLQVLLAAHTLMGALWKFSNTEQNASSLGALPHALWVGLTVPELAAAVVLVLPLGLKRVGPWVPFAAAFVAAEMLTFCAFHFASGDANHGPAIYWLVVAAWSAFVAVGRLKLAPHPRAAVSAAAGQG
jgi:hypothetical protein